MKSSLVDGKARVGVWGCGYIGFTSMVNFAKEGVFCVGYDVNQKVIDTVKRGECHIPNLDFWLGYHVGMLVDKMVTVTSDWQDMMADDIVVHLIAVPTENGGDPWEEPIKDVIHKLSQRTSKTLIIIESTLTPGMFDRVVIGGLEAAGKKVGEDVLVGIAPRRDWFDSPDKNLKSLNRVIGGTTPETSAIMKDVLGIVCDKLIVAKDAHTVELVKSVENSIFHICATYACQLARAYPNVDMADVLRLASTHWRIPLYYPSVGTGGYCIPVSSKYVRDGAPKPQLLGLTHEAIKSDLAQPIFIADMMAKRAQGSIGVLGLSYKRDLKVHVLSPALRIIERLKESGVVVKAHDPYYTQEEVKNITGVDSFKYPDDLWQFKGLIIVPPHRMFSQTPKRELMSCMVPGQVVLDNEGVWNKWREDFNSKGIIYHTVGDKGWSAE